MKDHRIRVQTVSYILSMRAIVFTGGSHDHGHAHMIPSIPSALIFNTHTFGCMNVCIHKWRKRSLEHQSGRCLSATSKRMQVTVLYDVACIYIHFYTHIRQHTHTPHLPPHPPHIYTFARTHIHIHVCEKTHADPSSHTRRSNSIPAAGLPSFITSNPLSAGSCCKPYSSKPARFPVHGTRQ